MLIVLSAYSYVIETTLGRYTVEWWILESKIFIWLQMIIFFKMRGRNVRTPQGRSVARLYFS